MPRLVSLTLLSVLVLPAAGLVYVVTVVLGYRFFGYREEAAVFMTANAITSIVVIAWWILLWGRAANWTASAGRLALATAGCVVLGVIAGAGVNAVMSDVEFRLFVGGVTTIIAWLVAACLIWRNPEVRRAYSSPEAEAAGSVTCLKCGYALNGLREARCPECGEIYTLDALLMAQPAVRKGIDLDRPDAAPGG